MKILLKKFFGIPKRDFIEVFAFGISKTELTYLLLPARWFLMAVPARQGFSGGEWMFYKGDYCI